MTRSAARSRRPFTWAVAVFASVAVTAALAACGTGNASQDKQEPRATGSPTPTAAAEVPDVPQAEPRAFPAVVQHAWGTTRIETEPERVVVLGFSEQDTMASLGVRPVNVRNFFGAANPWTSYPWLSDFARGGGYEALYFPIRDPNTGRTQELTDGPVLDDGFPQATNTPGRRQKEVYDLNAIRDLKPDLVLAMFSGMTLEDYQALQEIAPTIGMVSYPDYLEYYTSWQETTAALGKALGRPKAAAELAQDLTDRFLEFRNEHPEVFEASVALAAPGPNGTVKVINPYAPLARFFSSSLRMEFPGRILQATSGKKFDPSMFAVDLPAGDLGMLDDVDTLVWVVGRDGGEAMEQLKGSSAYKNLRAVRQDRVMELGPNEAEALYYNSPASLGWLLDRIEDRLAGTLADRAEDRAAAAAEAERRAEEAGDLSIDYQPTEDPQSYQVPEGDPAESASPDATASASPGTEETAAPDEGESPEATSSSEDEAEAESDS